MKIPKGKTHKISKKNDYFDSGCGKEVFLVNEPEEKIFGEIKSDEKYIFL